MEQTIHLSALLRKASEEIGVCLSADQIDLFMVYLKEIQTWNRSMNLTSITQGPDIVIKHFVDSLAALTAVEVPHGAKLLDVGTGAGFPGIPLRIAREDLNVTFVEPVKKKISFLHYMVGLLRLDRVKVFSGTLEQFITENAPYHIFDYITTRALRYDFILTTSLKLLAPGGKVILYSSRPINTIDIGSDWSLMKEHHLDLPNGLGRRLISILEVSSDR